MRGGAGHRTAWRRLLGAFVLVLAAAAAIAVVGSASSRPKHGVASGHRARHAHHPHHPRVISLGTSGRPSLPPLPPGVITHGSRSRRWVALTFDADMTRSMLARLRSHEVRSWYDARLFSELRAMHTPATIFLTGLWTEAYPDVVRRLAHDPLFELENHSLDHAGWIAPCYGLPTVTRQPSKRREIAESAAIIRRVAGLRPRFFRFPGGCEKPADVHLVESYGEHPVGWDVVSGDAFQSSSAAIVRAVLAGVRPGSIVIAHCIGAPNAPATAAAMAQIIPALRARGYRFVTVRKLLAG